MSDTHTLIVMVDPDPELSPEYEIECPGVTDSCRMWVECDIPRCGSTDAGRDHNIVLHGKKHQLIGSTWSVPTDTCYLVVADEMCDAADFLATKERLAAGRYVIGHDFDEGCIADFQLIEIEKVSR